MGSLKYAIIGSGTMGREHIRNINLLKNAEVVALCDDHEASIEESRKDLKNNPRIFSHHNDLIEAKIADVYIIATPNFTHIDILKDVIKTKAHLLIEKPLCTNVKDCFHFKKITKGYPGIIWTAMEYRYMPPVAKFIKEIQSGTIGDLKMFSIREHRFPFLIKVNDWNRFSKNTGGTLVEKCCHFFDLMRLVSNSEAVSVYASGAQDVNHLNEQYRGRKPDIIDNAFVIVNFENGIRSMLDLCMFSENSKLQEELCAVGNIGKIETGVPSFLSGKSSSELSIGLRKSNNILIENIEVDETILKAGHHHGSTYYEHLELQKAITENLRSQVSLDDGLKAVAIGQAAELSIIEKRVVHMKEILED